jgi:hypothetical protein
MEVAEAAHGRLGILPEPRRQVVVTPDRESPPLVVVEAERVVHVTQGRQASLVGHA